MSHRRRRKSSRSRRSASKPPTIKKKAPKSTRSRGLPTPKASIETKGHKVHAATRKSKLRHKSVTVQHTHKPQQDADGSTIVDDDASDACTAQMSKAQSGRQGHAQSPVADDKSPGTPRNENDVPKDPKETAKVFFVRTVRLGVDQLINEFNSLRHVDPSKMQTKEFHKNPGKNRYKDVVCEDTTRVRLMDGGNDYIHANYVSTNPSQTNRRFICTQAPTNTTVDDFWRMIDQEKVECVIMLCKTVEDYKAKCAPYFPDGSDTLGSSKMYGSVLVKLNEADKKLDWAKKKVVSRPRNKDIAEVKLRTLTVGSESRIVKHYQWTNWPDKGVPTDYTAIVNLLDAIKTDKTPIVVHCSAGIGRTGTLVVLEICLDLLARNVELDVGAVVKAVRRERPYSVQTNQQYLYLHVVLLNECINRGWVDYSYMNESAYGAFIHHYTQKK